MFMLMTVTMLLLIIEPESVHTDECTNNANYDDINVQSYESTDNVNPDVDDKTNFPITIDEMLDTDTHSNKYPSRECRRPQYLNDFIVGDEVDDAVVFVIDHCYTLTDIPKTYHEAVTSKNAGLWQVAMEDEMTALREKDTYDLVPLPEGRKPVGGRWVYSKKFDSDGNEKCKARFCCKRLFSVTR